MKQMRVRKSRIETAPYYYNDLCMLYVICSRKMTMRKKNQTVPPRYQKGVSIHKVSGTLSDQVVLDRDMRHDPFNFLQFLYRTYSTYDVL